MKYQDAEKAMAKVEDLYPDRNVYVISEPTDGPGDEPDPRSYGVQVNVGTTIDGDALEALAAISTDVECKLAVGPSEATEGGLTAVLS